MADSIEQKIINAIVVRLKLILTANGYVTGIGARVEDSRTNWAQDELPAISVFQGDVSPEPQDDERQLVERSIEVLIKVALERLDTATLTAALARNAIKDVYQAIRTDIFWTVGGVRLATETEEGSHGIVYGESFEIVGVQVAVKVKYISRWFNLES